MQRSRTKSVVGGPRARGTTLNSDSKQKAHTFQKDYCSESSMDKLEITNQNEHKNDQRNKYRLTYLQASLFATVIEDTITETKILCECNNEMRVTKIKADMDLLVALKYKVAQLDVTDELDGINPQQLGRSEYKLNKLECDRKYFLDLILLMYTELCLNKTFAVLVDYVDKIVNRDNYRLQLVEKEMDNKLLRRELNKQLKQQRNHIKTIIYDTDATIDELRSQLEDASLNSEICSRYVDNWQRSRAEQHIQNIQDVEVEPSNVIEYYKQRTDQEQRVHSEVELLINLIIDETLRKVEQWMDKYDEDMEGIDLKIQIKKNDYQNMRDKRINFEETIEQHDILMKEWISFKEEREKARLYREKMTKSAITVQAWWRGLLVRRQLGPFKVAKKKGAGAKKK